MQRRPDVPTMNSLDELDEVRSTTDPSPPPTEDYPTIEARPVIQGQPVRNLKATLPLIEHEQQQTSSGAPPTLRESDAPPAPMVPTATTVQDGLTPHSRKRTMEAISYTPVRPQAFPQGTDSLGSTLQSPKQQHRPKDRDLAGVAPSPDSTVRSEESLAPKTSLPANAPPWMRRARELASTLEASITLALNDQEPGPSVIAAVDRAYDSWAGGGFDSQAVATVADAVRRTYRTIMRPTQDTATVVAQAAHALFKELPPGVARWVSPTFLAQMVSELRSQTSERDAVVRGTMRILGWDMTSERSAERFIEAARADVDPR
ncbi:MAG: hypothetical protein H6718_15055 [Polyangiaceae bacterium]|nr:hypothetical protein [Polyangiaceae bacterium]MCB9606224.1 hypothetical protein [Polyangiaceae bacterium]